LRTVLRELYERVSGDPLVVDTVGALRGLEPRVPSAEQALFSLSATAAVLTAAQLGLRLLRISVATPILPSLAGAAAVALAGAAASCTVTVTVPPPTPTPKTATIPPITLTPGPHPAAFALVHLALFRIVFRGRFRSLAPSDLAERGAFASRSLNIRNSSPLLGNAYATAEQKAQLARWGRLFGCHHCGARPWARDTWIGDHIPPCAVVRSSLPFDQRLYPQCQPCSRRQASAVANARRTLVTHLLPTLQRAYAWAPPLLIASLL
jgi:hypothetical protein